MKEKRRVGRKSAQKPSPEENRAKNSYRIIG